MNEMTFETINGVTICYINGKEVSRSKSKQAGTTVIANPTLDRTEENLGNLQVGDTKYVPIENPLESACVFSYNEDNSYKKMLCVLILKNYEHIEKNNDEAYNPLAFIHNIYVRDESTGIVTTYNLPTMNTAVKVGGVYLFKAKDNVRYSYLGLTIDSTYSEKTISFWGTITYHYNCLDSNTGEYVNRDIVYTSNITTFTFPVIPAPETPQE